MQVGKALQVVTGEQAVRRSVPAQAGFSETRPTDERYFPTRAMRYLIVIAPNANNFDMNLSSRNGLTFPGSTVATTQCDPAASLSAV